MEPTELPVSDGYDDEGVDALYELAAGDTVRVETEDATVTGTLTERGDDGRPRRALWSRTIDTETGDMLLAVRVGEGTYLYTDDDTAEEVTGLSLVETGDAVLCELHAVHYPDGTDSDNERTVTLRAADLDAAREEYEERYGAVDYFAAAYEDVDTAMEIIAAEEGLND